MKEKITKGKLIILNIILAVVNLFVFYAFVGPLMRTSIDKPILYLYPKKKQKIKVKLEKGNLVKTSYPKYNDGWEVDAEPNGNLRVANKNYYALYWDEMNMKKCEFKEGFYVEKADAINFLEEKLEIIGLNERESNEFIMYWLPILENNEKNLVYFELTEERERNNKLMITPEPDSLLRVIIHVKKIKNKKEIKEQSLKTFTRDGFVAVEWGGVVYE